MARRWRTEKSRTEASRGNSWLRVADGSVRRVAFRSMTRSLTEYAAYLFDIDGTLLRPGSAIPGAIEALQALKAHGKAVRAVTNNSRMAHHAVAERFRRYGLPLDDDEVFSALLATAQF